MHDELKTETIDIIARDIFETNCCPNWEWAKEKAESAFNTMTAALKEQQEAWRPIETIPEDFKDDEYFLVMVKSIKDRVACAIGRMEEDGFYTNDRDKLSWNWNPTHWMPLPTPPKGE